jgi:hypothetical protein
MKSQRESKWLFELALMVLDELAGSGSVMPEPSLVATRRIEGAGEWSR